MFPSTFIESSTFAGSGQKLRIRADALALAPKHRRVVGSLVTLDSPFRFEARQPLAR